MGFGLGRVRNFSTERKICKYGEKWGEIATIRMNKYCNKVKGGDDAGKKAYRKLEPMR